MSAASPVVADAGRQADDNSTTAARLSDWEELVSLTRSTAASPAPRRRPRTEQLPSAGAAVVSSSSPHRVLRPQPPPLAAFEASLSLSSSSSPEAAAAKSGDEAVIDRLAGFRIRDRLQSAAEVERRLRSHRAVRLEGLERWWKEAENGRGSSGSAAADWSLFCILVSQSDIRATARGDGRYAIATLTDLRGRLLSCLLFDSALTALRPREAGSALAILNAKVSLVPAAAAASADSSSAFLPVSVSVSQAAQLLVLGHAQDFAFCSAYKRDAHTAADAAPSASMTRCRNVVDVSRSSYCDYHIAAEYRKIAGGRVGLHGGGVGGERAGLISFGPAATAANSRFGQRRGMKGGWSGDAGSSSDVVFMLPPERQTAGAMTAATREKLLSGMRVEQQRRRAETKPSLASILLAATPKRPHSSSAAPRLQQADAAASPSSATLQPAARLPARPPRVLSISASPAAPSAAAASPPAVPAEAGARRKRQRAEESGSGGRLDPSSSASPSRSSLVDVKRAALEELFGPVDLSCSAAQSLLSASSARLALLSDMTAEERDDYWAFLMQKQPRQQQTAATTPTQRKTAGADQIQ